MSLSIEAAVLGVADALRDRIAPALGDDFAIETSRLSAIMLTIMANAADDAVVLRVEENAAIRALLGEATDVVGQTGLAARLKDAAVSTDPGLRISELDAETDRLRHLLIEAQIVLEGSADPAARALDQRIWRFLADVETKRAPRL